MINWKVRVKNKVFWLSLIPAMIILVQTVGSVFGFKIELADLSDKLIAVIESVFVVLTILGIVNDPTTAGISDSKQAMTYEEPKE